VGGAAARGGLHSAGRRDSEPGPSLPDGARVPSCAGSAPWSRAGPGRDRLMGCYRPRSSRVRPAESARLLGAGPRLALHRAALLPPRAPFAPRPPPPPFTRGPRSPRGRASGARTRMRTRDAATAEARSRPACSGPGHRTPPGPPTHTFAGGSARAWPGLTRSWQPPPAARRPRAAPPVRVAAGSLGPGRRAAAGSIGARHGARGRNCKSIVYLPRRKNVFAAYLARIQSLNHASHFARQTKITEW
jgi:hypothetical protein